MREEQGALHFEVLHAIPGRLRIHLEKPIESSELFGHIAGVTDCAYNPRLQTLLCRYDHSRVDEETMIVRLGAVYAAALGTRLLHIKRSEEPGFSLSTSGILALGLIGLDAAATLSGASIANVTRWLSTGATFAAVVEHGYQELQSRGTFDPEVMSIVYLINAIGKPTAVQASLVAWIATFGRHLIPRAPREQVYLVYPQDKEIKLIPMHDRQNSRDYAGKILRRSAQMLAKVR